MSLVGSKGGRGHKNEEFEKFCIDHKISRRRGYELFRIHKIIPELKEFLKHKRLTHKEMIEISRMTEEDQKQFLDIIKTDKKMLNKILEKKGKKMECKYCGKNYARSGLRLHEKYCKQKNQQAETEKSTSKKVLESAPKVEEQKSTAVSNDGVLEKSTQKVMEVNLMESFEKSKGLIEPKKEEKKEEENNYKCGSCNEEFYSKKKPNHCPNCGVEF